jgi:hypothetical protein
MSYRPNPVRKFSGFILLALSCVPLILLADPAGNQHLFIIERSKNANIVQYDAQVGPDGKLVKKDPVVAYWVRLAEQGQVEKLSWVQKTFAYGFKARLDGNRETVKLEMKADFSRPITIIREGDKYRATARIDGAPSYLEKIFVNASRKGISFTVHYVELHGEDVKTGEALYEKFVP